MERSLHSCPEHLYTHRKPALTLHKPRKARISPGLFSAISNSATAPIASSSASTSAGSTSLYAVSSDIDGAAIAKASSLRGRRSIVALFASAKEGLSKDPEVITAVVLAALNGVARTLLESKSPERQLEPLRDELITLVHTCLRTCAATPLA